MAGFGSLTPGGADEFYDPYWQEVELQKQLQAEDRAKEEASKRTWGDTVRDVAAAPGRIWGSLISEPEAGSTAAKIKSTAGPYVGAVNGRSTQAGTELGNLASNLTGGFADAVHSGLTLYDDMRTGKEPMYDQHGGINPRIVERSFDLASLGGGGSIANTARSAARNAVGRDMRLFGKKVGSGEPFPHQLIDQPAWAHPSATGIMDGPMPPVGNPGYEGLEMPRVTPAHRPASSVDAYVDSTIGRHANDDGLTSVSNTGSRLLSDTSKPGATVAALERSNIPSKGKDVLGRDIPEWRDAQVYHFTDPEAASAIEKGGYKVGSGYYGNMVSFTPDPTYARQFGDVATHARVSKDAKILNLNDPADWETYQRITKNARGDQIAEAVSGAGYHGVYDAGAGDLFIADPRAVKYEKSTKLASDTGKPGAAIAAIEHAQPWFSSLDQAVAGIPQARMTGSQWAGTLANRGAKLEEMDWRGVSDFLKTKADQPVTKAELEAHLGANKVELKPVSKTTSAPEPKVKKKKAAGFGSLKPMDD